jgi:CRISPR/Cas system-associated exonuclease Cas4 (RecB family)
MHKFIQDIVKGCYLVEVMIKTDDVLGYADLVSIDEVADIKTVRSYAFKLMKGKKEKNGQVIPYDFKKDKKDNILQVVFYAKTLGKKKGRLVFIDKDSLDIIEYEFNIEEFEKELQEELDILNGFWNNKKLPPPFPRCYNGKECEYCGYQDKCKGEKDVTKSKEY